MLLLARVSESAAQTTAPTKESCVDAANRAQTLRDGGKYIASRAMLLTCSSDSCPSLVSQTCRQWLTQAEADLPTVIFSVRDDRGHDRADVKVSVDGVSLLDRLGGIPVSIDPGEHVIRFEAPGLSPREEQVVLHVHEKERLVTVELSSPVPIAPPKAEVHERPVPEPSSSASRNALGITLAALAVGSAAGGGYLVARSHRDADSAAALRENIPSPSGCTAAPASGCGQLSDDVAAEHRDTNVSTALFVSAGVLALGAAATWIFWPSHGSVRSSAFAPRVVAGGSRVDAGWTFP